MMSAFAILARRCVGRGGRETDKDTDTKLTVVAVFGTQTKEGKP